MQPFMSCFLSINIYYANYANLFLKELLIFIYF